jgi:hypothetical protein
MSKVVILWINFSSSTSYPNGPVDSGMSLYCADVVNAEINKSYPLCDCKQLCNRVIQVDNCRCVEVDIEDIRTLDGKSAVDLLRIDLFYEILGSVIKNQNKTFNFGNGNNLAMLIDDNDYQFNNSRIVYEFAHILEQYYEFNVSEISDVNDIDTIPLMNIDNKHFAKFINWMNNKI